MGDYLVITNTSDAPVYVSTNVKRQPWRREEFNIVPDNALRIEPRGSLTVEGVKGMVVGTPKESFRVV